jgi:hypothetical protein
MLASFLNLRSIKGMNDDRPCATVSMMTPCCAMVAPFATKRFTQGLERSEGINQQSCQTYYLSLVHQLSRAFFSINRITMSDNTASAHTSGMGTGSSNPTGSTTTGPPKPSQSTSFHIFNDGGSNFGLRVPDQYTHTPKPDWYLQRQKYAFDVARSLSSQISDQDALESKVQSLCDKFRDSRFSLKPTNVSFERLEPKDFKYLKYPKNVMKLDLQVTDVSSQGAVPSMEGSRDEKPMTQTAGTPSMSATDESQFQ